MRNQARAIWDAAVAAADAFALVSRVLRAPPPELRAVLDHRGRILVVGGGKAGAAMAAGVEAAFWDRLDRVRGVVNVPEDMVRPLQAIRLHAARAAATNEPAAAGVAGVDAMLDLVERAGRDDIGLCLLSGGGSALLPAPVAGVRLEEKQLVTRLLHACGATIGEMNCVRKHLSRIKGGRLAEAFAARDRPLVTLILSDVVGDPLDVIASGPTAVDPTTFGDARGVLERYGLLEKAPQAVRNQLERGRDGLLPETPKVLPSGITNFIVGNNAGALAAATAKAAELGWGVLNLGAFIEGETRQAAVVLAGIIRSILHDQQPVAPPLCLLSGGETTVTLTPAHGRGGRNQELVLALLTHLPPQDLEHIVILSGGTDGEDGPTDAAGAVADAATVRRAGLLGLTPLAYLDRHDAYQFFDATGDLLRTGLTGTNVMDIRVVLIAPTTAKGAALCRTLQGRL
jgi:hydroxypyruvate reductase/glycerate 2-kinase